MAIKVTDNPEIPPQAGGLLSLARGLVGHEKEIERATASRFNLFQIVGVGHYEVSTHSALLANLLDPQGSHGQGPVFLKRFIEMPAIYKAPGFPVEFDADSAQVRCEVSIGTRTETTGGRLDILITDKSNRWKIAIENKIHAAEQENWVERYLRSLRSNGCLLYLTLSGDAPVQAKSADLKDQFQCISYAITIKGWLEDCRKEVAMVPIIRESLTQYIHLIDDLTNQNRNRRMNEQIVKSVLNDPETFDAYCALRSADKYVKGQIVRDLGERIRPRIPDGFKLESTPKGNCDSQDGFVFSTQALADCNVNAVVSFDSPNYANCYYGFELIETSQPFGNRPDDLERLARCFKNVFGWGPINSGRWPAWKYWTPQDWNDEVMRRIKFGGNDFDGELLRVIGDLLDVAEQFANDSPPIQTVQP